MSSTELQVTSSHLRYIAALPTGKNPCTAEDRWYDEAAGTWLCYQCGGFRNDVQGVDVVIQEAVPAGALNFLWGTQLGLAKRDLLETLGIGGSIELLRLGRVVGATGAVLPDWVSFHGLHKTILRGSQDVMFRRCPECQRPIYFATGRKYLCPTPNPELDVLDAGKGALILASRPEDSIPTRKWKGVSISEVPVLEVPLDRLPATSLV
jgi:hypothetical protein